MALVTATSADPLVKSGKVKMLSSGGAKRAYLSRTRPAWRRRAIPTSTRTRTQGIRAGRHARIVNKLHAAVVAALRNPEVRTKLQEMGGTPAGQPPGSSRHSSRPTRSARSSAEEHQRAGEAMTRLRDANRARRCSTARSPSSAENAGQGLGATFARALAESGCRVVAVDIHDAPVQALAAHCAKRSRVRGPRARRAGDAGACARSRRRSASRGTDWRARQQRRRHTRAQLDDEQLHDEIDA